MSTKITAPRPVDGEVTSYFGPHIVVFKDGIAEVDFDLTDGMLAYLYANGYGVNGDSATTPDPEPTPADPRDHDTPEQVGTDLRDAAVDPEEGDFLPPTNAGEANPHGGDVVAPEIHASQGVRPVKAGPVHADDIEKQSDAEVDHAEAATDGTPVELTKDELTEAVKEGDDVALSQVAIEDLKGDALQAALRDAGLPLTGTADEKRARLQEHRDGQVI